MVDACVGTAINLMLSKTEQKFHVARVYSVAFPAFLSRAVARGVYRIRSLGVSPPYEPLPHRLFRGGYSK